MAQFPYILNLTGDCTSSNLGSAELIPYGGTQPYTFQWLNPSLGTDTSVSASTRTTMSAGTYVVLITDSASPTNNETYVNVSISSGICSNIISVEKTTCGLDNGVVEISASTPLSTVLYILYDTNNNLVQSSTTSYEYITLQGLSAGTYYVIANDIGGCTGKSETFIVEDSNSFDFGFYNVPNATCTYEPSGKLYVTGLTGTPPYTYLWNNGGTNNFITGLTGGQYSVNVTDSLGCSLIKSTTIETVGIISVGIITANPPSCLSNDGSLSIQITGGTPPYYYSASTGYVEISYASGFTLNSIGAGPYTINVTDAGFCQTSISTVLNTPAGMTSVDVQTKNTNCSFSEGSISVSVQGGNIPYQYILTYPDSSDKTVNTNTQQNLFSNLSAGTYNLSVVDSSGCTYSNNYTIYNELSFSISADSVSATYGQNNGSVTVTKTTGGTEPFTYSLDGDLNYFNTSLSAVTFYDLSSGQHEVVVVDSVGCKQSTYVNVGYVPVVDFLLASTSAGSNSGGTITAMISSGIPPFSFNWSDNVLDNPQTITVTGLTAGTYSLVVIDSNGSSLKRTTTINGGTTLNYYESYTVGEQTFELVTNTKYSLSKMLNEGFQDITSGQTGCILSSATFTTKVKVASLYPEVTETFYTTYSLLDSPQDNLFYDSIQNLLSSSIGVGEVIINQIDNKITILSDVNRQDLVPSFDIKVYLLIDYDIYCTG
jgi:hypothetical protein